MLEVRDLAFGFRGRTVGSGVGLELAAGETLCVLGPNGGGKTTLFRTLLGLLPSKEGSVKLAGEPIESLPRAEMARRIGYVPQGQAASFAYTALEFVLMGRTAHLGVFGAPGRRDRAVAAQALEALGIAHLADRSVTEVSGGERQLALIARAVAQQPRLLVMDEPTANLDFGNQVRVLERIAGLAGGERAVLFSTHNPDHAFLAADRVLLLGEGRALAYGAPRDVIRANTLQRLYGVQVSVVELAPGRHTCLPALSR